MENKVSKSEKITYGGFFLGQNIYYAIVASFLMIYYTEYVGLGALDVGIMFAIARFWDAINDPIMGIIIDKTNFKSGKFIPWLRAVTFILPVSMILLFTNPFAGASYSVKLIYAYVTYIAFGMVYTLSDVPIFAQSTVVSSDVGERTSYLMMGRMFAMIGALVAVVIFPILSEKIGFTTAAYILTIIGFFIMIPFVFNAKERIEPEKTSNYTVGQMIKTVLQNKYLVIYFSSFLILRGLLVNTVAGNYFFYYVMNNPKLVSILGLMGVIPAILLAALMPKIVAKIGKKKFYIFLNVLSICAGVGLYFIGYDSETLVILLSTILGFAVSASSIMMGLFVGDCIEYGEYKTGHRNEGLSFSVQTFSNKAATGINALVAGGMLKVIGYTDSSAINAEIAQGLFTMSSLIPAIGVTIALVIFIVFYNLSETEVSKMISINQKQRQ